MTELAQKDALLFAELENRAEERRLINEIDKLADANIEAQARIKADLGVANDAVAGLYAEVSRANARGDTSATAVADAARARALLAQCAARYRDVARRADELRATVLGLQSFARSVSSRTDQ
ncbi:hypothetical protein [Roseobacter sp. CCS2]|uniref:hypothetical protein n=1 Tax=Roseobacter sp. CCS2 TaxID=391593 RepID=UPI0012E9BA47|nr:hypothetical protein [Roseobacter sp. CCS2]